MPRQAVLPIDTTLYHPTEGRYTFPAGSPDPGGMWTESPGGDAIGKASAEQARKDLAAAETRFAEMNARMERQAEALDVLAKERDAALAKAAEAVTAREAAESAQTAAEEALKAVVLERDAARDEAAKLRAGKKL
jgi:hypothetical protein